MFGDAKPKKMGAKKGAMKAGHSPIPKGAGSGGAMCGHSGCMKECQVRYVGHTSRISDHYMVHTARAVSNIWAAAIVVGLSVVLTGAIAFSTVEAKTERDAQQTQHAGGLVRADTARIMARLDMMEKAVQDLKVLCSAQFPVPEVKDSTGKLTPGKLPLHPPGETPPPPATSPTTSGQ